MSRWLHSDWLFLTLLTTFGIFPSEESNWNVLLPEFSQLSFVAWFWRLLMFPEFPRYPQICLRRQDSLVGNYLTQIKFYWSVRAGGGKNNSDEAETERDTILERSTDMFYKFELTAKLALQVIVLRIQSLLRGLAEWVSCTIYQCIFECSGFNNLSYWLHSNFWQKEKVLKMINQNQNLCCWQRGEED